MLEAKGDMPNPQYPTVYVNYRGMNLVNLLLMRYAPLRQILEKISEKMIDTYQDQEAASTTKSLLME